MASDNEKEFRKWYENRPKWDPFQLMAKGFEKWGPSFIDWIASELGKEGIKNDTLGKAITAITGGADKRSNAQARAIKADNEAKRKEEQRIAAARRKVAAAELKEKTLRLDEVRRQEALRLRALRKRERQAKIKEGRRLLSPSSLNIAMTPSSTTTTPSVPADNNQDSVLFNFEAEKAPVAAKTISANVMDNLFGSAGTSPRGDIGEVFFEHPEGRPDLRKGGLTATNNKKKKKKRSDARTNRIVAEYNKIKKSKKKVATDNGKKRTKR